MPAKRQHYVPRFYLDYFTVKRSPTAAPGFYVYDKDGTEARFQTPANTAVEGYFYTLEREDGTRDESVEKVLATVESDTKPILDRWLLVDARIERDDKAKVALFLALMHTRGPRNIDAVREMTTVFTIEHMKDLAERPEELRQYLQGMKAEDGTDWPLEEAIDALRNIEERFKLTIGSKYPLTASLQQADSVREELMGMDWVFGVAPEGLFFVTGDTPLSVFLPSEDGRASFGGGFGHEAVEITIPLCPQKCLVIFRERRDRRVRWSADELNRRTAYMAERYVISANQTPQVAALVERARVTRSYPKLDREEFGRVAREALAMHRAANEGEKRKE